MWFVHFFIVGFSLNSFAVHPTVGKNKHVKEVFDDILAFKHVDSSQMYVMNITINNIFTKPII